LIGYGYGSGTGSGFFGLRIPKFIYTDPGSEIFLTLGPGFRIFLTLNLESGIFLTLDPGYGMEKFGSRIGDKRIRNTGSSYLSGLAWWKVKPSSTRTGIQADWVVSTWNQTPLNTTKLQASYSRITEK
jgi:hypothetical protein